MASDRDSGSDEDEFSEPDGLTELHQGIVNNDLTLLQQALESGVSPNEKFTAEMNPQHDGMTPLALAAALNKVEAVKLLLTYEADVNDTFASLKTTALMTSSFHGHSEIVRVLLKKGASVRAIDLQGSTALGYAFGGARTTEVIHQLLKAGVDVNQKNMLGMSSLLLVAGYGNDVMTKMILDAGADAKSTNDFGHSALHLTVVGKRSQIKKLMSGQTGSYGLNRRNIDVALKEWARLHSDTVRGHDNELELEKVGEFMMSIGSKLDEREHISDDDNEAMKRRVEAVWRHRQDKIQAQKEKKKKSGVLDNFLSCGGKRGKQAKLAKQHGSKSPMARPFVPLDNDPGKSVGSSDVDRNINQISDSCSKILRMIIDHGCEIDWVEKTFGMTALDMAILLGDVESTAVLVAAGGDSNHLMKMFALTDLYEAIVQLDKKQVKEVLTFDSDVDVNQTFSQFNVTRRRGTGETDNLKSDGLTPLTVAAQMNESEIQDIMKMLLKQGADINKVGPGGSCPLAEACRMGNLKMVQFLVSQGANIETSCPSYKDATPVTIAAMSGHRPIVEFLLAKEAKIDKPMSDGRSALVKAVDNGDWEMVELIFNANLLDNFSDRNNFTHEMAERYQRPDRDFESLKRSITDEARRLAERDREQNAEKDKTARNSTSARPVAERQSRQKQMTLDDPVPPSQGRRNRTEQQGQRSEQPGQRPEQMSLDDPVPPSQQGRTNDAEQQKQRTEQQRQRPKQQKEVKPPPSPEESSEDDEEDEREEQKKKQLKQQQEQKHQPKHVQQQQQQQQQQPKQQKHQQPPVQSPPVKLPPPPAESSNEEEDEEEEEEEVPPYRQQPQQKQQQQQQQQQPKQQQQQQPKQQQQQPKHEQPKQQQLQKEQVSKPLPQEVTSSDEEEEEEKEASGGLQQKHQQPPAGKTAAAAAAPALAQKKQSSSEEEEEEEDEEDEEEEEEVKPAPPAQVQKQVNSQVPAVKPPGDQVLKVSQVPVVKPPGDQVLKVRQVQKQESSSEEEETEEEEESEEEEEEEIKVPPQKAVAAASVLPSDKFENRANPAMPNKPAAQEKPARQDIAQTKPDSSASAIQTRAPAAAVSVRSPVSPTGPPPPLPSAGPPSETPTESEEDDDDDEDWDEDEDFEENHIDVASKEDELSGPSKNKVGSSGATTVTTTKSSGGVTTRTVVTKTVVTSNVTTRSEPFKGQAKIAKIEDSDDDDDGEDDDDEEDDDEEESDESHERPRHHNTETDI